MDTLPTLDMAAPVETISRQVARVLRQAVVTMRIKPGEMLSEQDVGKRLGVSRSPVREAFIKLSEMGLVRILPQRGTLVVKISRAAVEDARFVRQAIECAVVRDLAARATPQLAAALDEAIEAQRLSLKAGAGEAFFRQDEEFHRLLAVLAGRPSAWDVIETVKAQMDRVRFLSTSSAIPMDIAIHQHRAVVDAIKRRDADGAEAAMRAHLSEILKSLAELSVSHAQFFEPESAR